MRLKSNKFNVKYFVIMFLLTLTLTQFISTTVYAKNDKKVTLYTNDSRTFKVPKTRKNVKWTISKKGYASILGTRGYKKNIATIKTGSKPGVCILKAKAGSKMYSWRLTIKRDINISRATLVNVKKSEEELNVTIKLTNRSKSNKEYGTAYFVESFRVESGKK